MPVSFEGAAPYGLPVAQSARAEAVNDTVEVTLRMVVNGSPEPVTFQMTLETSLNLAGSLQAATIQAEKNRRG